MFGKIGNIATLGMFFGMIGTTMGGVFGAFTNIKSKKIINLILGLTAIFMLVIIFFDLLPESLKFIDLKGVVCGVLAGIVVMFFCNEVVNDKIPSFDIALNGASDKTMGKNINKLSDSDRFMSKFSNKILLKAGIVIGIGLCIHNFPEGLAIGSGFEASNKLGISLAIAICLHDFPEGIAMAVPLKQGGYGKLKVIFYTALSGITTGLGALAGALIGNVSSEAIGLSLGFAGGAMLYIALNLISLI